MGLEPLPCAPPPCPAPHIHTQRAKKGRGRSAPRERESLASTMEDARRRAERLEALLRFARPIASGLVKEFFTDGLWEAVPASWREPLEALPLRSLAELLSGRGSVDVPPGSPAWPLSLLAFVAACHAERLPGQLETATPASAVANGRCAEEALLDKQLRRAVNPKKMHEIVRLGALADRLGRAAGCDEMVDVGSGQGYLSRALAFEHSWTTVGVEAVSSNVVAARKIDDAVRPKLRSQLEARQPLAPLRRTIVCFRLPLTERGRKEFRTEYCDE